jgi:hypothetical protein
MFSPTAIAPAAKAAGLNAVWGIPAPEHGSSGTPFYRNYGVGSGDGRSIESAGIPAANKKIKQELGYRVLYSLSMLALVVNTGQGARKAFPIRTTARFMGRMAV